MSEDGNTNLNTVDLGLLLYNCFFDLYSMTFQEVYLSEKHNPYCIIFVLAGIFVVSYFSWKKKLIRENSTALPNNNSVK
jgi:hypothetical protein